MKFENYKMKIINDIVNNKLKWIEKGFFIFDKLKKSRIYDISFENTEYDILLKIIGEHYECVISVNSELSHSIRFDSEKLSHIFKYDNLEVKMVLPW